MSTVDNSSLTLTMPSLGETMERGTVAEWLVNEGEAFKRGDSIIEFETDKTAVEYPALGAGVLRQQLVKPGDEVEVGAPIALIDIGDGPDWVSDGVGTTDTENSAGTTAKADLIDDEADSANQQPFNQDAASDNVDASLTDDNTQQCLRATPVARNLARQYGISLDEIIGTGRRGRIEARDVETMAATTVKSSFTSVSSSQNGRRAAGEPDRRHAGGIAYSVSGSESGPRYLLLHGFAADASAWSLLSRALVRAGCYVVCVDLPSHGATEVDAPDVDSLHHGLSFVLDAIEAKDKPLHFIAHSLGTTPAVNLVQYLMDSGAASREDDQTRPVRSLSLISPVGLGLFIDAQFVRGMANPSSVGELSHLLRRLSDHPSTLTTAALEQLYAVLKQGRLTHLAESMLGLQGQTINHHHAIGVLSKLLPVRILVGHNDRIIAWQDVLHVAPSVVVHHFPNAGHMPHWDYPTEVADIVLSAT